jgi:hypothetical protein
MTLRTHGTPVHERAPVVWGRDGRDRELSGLLGPDLADQIPQVAPAHGVRHRVHAAAVLYFYDLMLVTGHARVVEQSI